ncbi:MAG: isoprenylcysteine carboxyl methyltransferase [Desulfotomaculaceae bacterium]|nr:isoprenylcysteine carboxyl methyltransferase [Desulfotomaculaceae bacterium]
MADNNSLTPGKIIFTLIYILLFPTLLLSLSGDWLWREGWIFSIWFTVLCFATIIRLYRHDPDLLSERYRKPGTGSQEGWDRYVVLGLLIGFFAWVVIMPLDAKRYGWTGYLPLWIKTFGFIVLLFSFFLFYRSYAENTFVSALDTGRAQAAGYFNRSIRVCAVPHVPRGNTDVYRNAMLLGSIYGIVIGLAMFFLIAARIVGEEKMLVNELEGYEDYQKKVRYRLLPYIW